MADFPALPLFTDAYLADTAHLTNEEHGVYLRLLMFAWRSQGCALPDNDKRLATMVGVTEKKWKALRPVMAEFWTIQDGLWTQKRLTRERDFVRSKTEKNRDAAEARWRSKPLKNNDTNDADAYATAMPNGCQNDAPTPTPTVSSSSSSARENAKNPVQPEPVAVGDWTPDKLHDHLIAAVGLQNRGSLPTYWLPPSAPIHAWRWITDLGLTPEQVLDCARQSRQRHSDPPTGPKALDAAMRRLAAAIKAPPLTPAEAALGAAPAKRLWNLDPANFNPDGSLRQ